MMSSFKKIVLTAALSMLVFSFNSCVKDDFDAPPTGGQDPNLEVTHTIASLKALYDLSAGIPYHITTDVIIAGVVIADDESGNFYKEVVLQDSTGGISIILDQSEYHNIYKTGVRVFVKCKNLYINDYNGLIQMGGYIEADGDLARIPASLVSKHLIPGSYYHYVTPKKLSQLLAGNDLQNTLVEFDSVEFVCGQAGVTTYADAVNKEDVNTTLTDCAGNLLTLRSSGFGNFASAMLPGGNGKIVGVLQIYDTDGTIEPTDFQLKVRDLADVNMHNVRCDGGTGVGVTLTSINEDFTGLANNADLAFCDWYSLATKGNRKWQSKIFSGNTYAQATAFASSLAEMECWMITPPFDLSVADTLTFQSATAFWTHNGLTVWISTDFNGSNIATANWTQLTCNLATSGDPNYTFEPSGIISLTGFSGTAHIGFKYTGSDTNGLTGTYQVDDVSIH